MLLQLCHNDINPKSLPIRSISRHRINRIRNHYYSRSQWYLFTPNSIRIASAVPPLVMTTNRFKNSTLESRNNPN